MFEECNPKNVKKYGKIIVFSEAADSYKCLKRKADYIYFDDYEEPGLEIYVVKGEEIIVSGFYEPSLAIPYDIKTDELLREVDKIVKQNPDDIRGVFLNIIRKFDAGDVYRQLPSSVVEKLFALNLYFRLNKDRFE